MCDVGKRAQEPNYIDGRVFPQDILAAPHGYRNRQDNPVTQTVASYENWRWEVFLVSSAGGGKKRWSICPDHSQLLLKSWEEIYRVEVSDYNAFHAYMDRIER
jgi:hypothetical protein